METVECSKEIYFILDAFNKLSTKAEQEEVADVIFDALYKKKIQEVLSSYVITSMRHEYDLLKAKYAQLQSQFENATKNQNKKLIYHRTVAKKLLIIISNIKHYLGNGWNSVFPFGMKDVEKFLSQVDIEKILSTDTWSKYENAALSVDNSDPEFRHETQSIRRT